MKKPKRREDRHAMIRGLPSSIVPPIVVPRKGAKYAEPEDTLQNEVNEALSRAGQFYFRIPAHVYAKANDKSIKG